MDENLARRLLGNLIGGDKTAGLGPGNNSIPAFAKLDESIIRGLKPASSSGFPTAKAVKILASAPSRAGGLAGLVGGTQNASADISKALNGNFSNAAPGPIVGAPDTSGAFGALAAFDGAAADTRRGGRAGRSDDDKFEDITITLRSYQLGTAPIYGEFDHAYVQIEVEESGRAYILRGGPSETYEDYASREQAVSGSPVKGKNGSVIYLKARLDPINRSPDRPGYHSLIARSFRYDSLNDVLATARRVARAYNNERSAYKPRTNNSNTFARDAFELVGARDFINSIPRLPGSARENRRKIP